MSTVCSILRCKEEDQDTGVGTSTSCSASCGAQRTVRAARGGHTILGTSITCSATRKSKGERTPNSNYSTISGTGTSKVGSNRASTIWSTMFRWTRSTSPRGSARRWPRPPVEEASGAVAHGATRAPPHPWPWAARIVQRIKKWASASAPAPSAG